MKNNSNQPHKPGIIKPIFIILLSCALLVFGSGLIKRTTESSNEEQAHTDSTGTMMRSVEGAFTLKRINDAESAIAAVKGPESGCFVIKQSGNHNAFLTLFDSCC